MICKNIACKHNDRDRCGIVRKVKIGRSGMCESFEKGFAYYTDLVFDALANTNMILPLDLTTDLRIGLYYVMKIFHLGFSEVNFGPVLGRAYMLKRAEDKEGLKTSEIVQLPLDHDVLLELMTDFTKGILPGPGMEDKQQEPPKKTSQPFGWLSPTGEFTEGDFGDHEKVAHDIITAKGLREEWRLNQFADTGRDFLSRRGYALIHNPTGLGGYIVSHEKPLTKKQRDFLYGYFADIGDTLMANKYMEVQE